MSEALPSHIGTFSILKSIGKGGMGEVFLAYDSTCKREVALKKIRTDLSQKTIIKNRFLKEAIITSQLAHPSIVPIYSIHEERDFLYYIMPYLQGETLKDCIKRAKQDALEKTLSHEGSIASFLRVFLSVCQAIAYAHSKGFLHRDIKPENIIIGKYGQVYILDWGLVKSIHDTSDETIELDEEAIKLKNLTSPGKLLGTLAFMAPERLFGHSSSISSDIYALGVILYQILTLYLPFKRKNIKEFKEKVHKEKLIPPEQAAPYRDVPLELSRIVKICLDPDPNFRYPSVDLLIADIENYLQGQSEWFKTTSLNIETKSDWEFQEHVLIPEPIVTSKYLTKSDWNSIMISKESFPGNTQVKARIKIHEMNSGIGFLFCVPEASERVHPTDGYCLWLSTNKEEPTKLFRRAAEVMELPDIILPQNEWLTISIRKVDRHIQFYINDVHKFTYISYLPLTGTKVGLSFKDTHFTLEALEVFLGSLSVQVSCLAVPDAFLASKNYDKALIEYRRIGSSFQGRAEGREGLFRAGITLLENAKAKKSKEDQQHLFNLALLEFEKLRNTPGAPLEYLGKALIYETMQENEEEVKCFELGLRRYPKHPLQHLLEEQIIFRLHNRYKQERALTYRFILLILKILPGAIENRETKNLIEQVECTLEKLYFIETINLKTLEYKDFAIQIAFWLAKKESLAEIFDTLIIENPLHLTLMKNCLYCLLELGASSLVLERVPEISPPSFALPRALATLSLDNLEDTFAFFKKHIKDSFNFDEKRALLFLFEYALTHKKEKLVISFFETFSKNQELVFADSALIKAYLLQKNWRLAGKQFQNYSLSFLSQENSLLHFLYGCFLFATEGKEVAYVHLSGAQDTPFPKIAMLGTHFLYGKGIDPHHWLEQSFFYEKRELYKQLSLYYHCANNQKESEHYLTLATTHETTS